MPRLFDEHRDYRDFVPSRFRCEAELIGAAPHPPEADEAWNTQVPVRIVPDPRLEPRQRGIIEQDYGMQDGALVITTRGALVQYLLQLLHIDLKIPDGNPAAQQIVVENRQEVARWTFA
jgi:hypothetical protein